jgi:hypothetical protein
MEHDWIHVELSLDELMEQYLSNPVVNNKYVEELDGWLSNMDFMLEGDFIDKLRSVDNDTAKKLVELIDSHNKYIEGIEAQEAQDAIEAPDVIDNYIDVAVWLESNENEKNNILFQLVDHKLPIQNTFKSVVGTMLRYYYSKGTEEQLTFRLIEGMTYLLEKYDHTVDDVYKHMIIEWLEGADVEYKGETFHISVPHIIGNRIWWITKLTWADWPIVLLEKYKYFDFFKNAIRDYGKLSIDKYHVVRVIKYVVQYGSDTFVDEFIANLGLLADVPEYKHHDIVHDMLETMDWKVSHLLTFEKSRWRRILAWVIKGMLCYITKYGIYYVGYIQPCGCVAHDSEKYKRYEKCRKILGSLNVDDQLYVLREYAHVRFGVRNKDMSNEMTCAAAAEFYCRDAFNNIPAKLEKSMYILDNANIEFLLDERCMEKFIDKIDLLFYIKCLVKPQNIGTLARYKIPISIMEKLKAETKPANIHRCITMFIDAMARHGTCHNRHPDVVMFRNGAAIARIIVGLSLDGIDEYMGHRTYNRFVDAYLLYSMTSSINDEWMADDMNLYMCKAVQEMLDDMENARNAEIIKLFGDDRLSKEHNLMLLQKHLRDDKPIPDVLITRWLKWPVE